MMKEMPATAKTVPVFMLHHFTCRNQHAQFENHHKKNIIIIIIIIADIVKMRKTDLIIMMTTMIIMSFLTTTKMTMTIAMTIRSVI